MTKLAVRSILVLSFTLLIGLGCSTTLTNVGSSLDDGGSGDALGSTPDPNETSTGDANAPDGNASLEAAADGPLAAEDAAKPCAAGQCGANVCGRDECATSCGTCPGALAQDGCFMGKCQKDCPGTPCRDLSGEHVCEGGRGGRACIGGTLGIQVCTCSGGGVDAWGNCGPCL